MTAGRPGGLRSAAPSRPRRDEAFEFPRGRQAAAAIHRDRRLKFATTLLALTLVIGVYWIFAFWEVSSAPGEPIGDLSGLVVDPNSRPIVGAIVSVEGSELYAITDANGSFTLHDVPSGRLTLTVRQAGYVTSSFTVVAAPTAPGKPSPQPELLEVEAGSGTSYQDLATQREWWRAACMSTFLIGTVLNGVGLVATIGRRRYSHAMLGCVGAILSFSWIFGLLFGGIAMILLMGAREEFEDRRSLFATEHDMPFPRAADGDDGRGDDGRGDDGRGDDGRGDDGGGDDGGGDDGGGDVGGDGDAGTGPEGGAAEQSKDEGGGEGEGERSSGAEREADA